MRTATPSPLSRPLRVLMTADTVGGVFSYAVALIEALAERNVEVVLATMGRALSDDQRRELARVSPLAVCESSFALEWMDDPWDGVDAAGEWLLSLEQQFTPDVVHVNGYAHAALPWTAPTLVVAHSSVTTWWPRVLGGEAPERYSEYRRRLSRGLQRAACVVAPTRAMLSDLARWDGFSGKGVVIPNGVNPERYVPQLKEPFLLAAGRLWDKAKNLDAIARAASNFEWPVLVAGDDGANAPESTTAAPDKLRLLGIVSRGELAAVMGRASVFLHPARYEPFGLAPLEAALAGCALVLGDIPSLREVWGDAALYVAPEDREALVSTVRRLTGDTAELQRAAGRARARAATYGLARMGDGYRAAYDALTSPRFITNEVSSVELGAGLPS